MSFTADRSISDVFVGTVVRAAPVREGGEIMRLNWPQKSVEIRKPVFPTNPAVESDSNPRGNSRGCRGVLCRGDRVLFANYHTIEVSDRDLVVHDKISDSLFVGLHELWLDDPDSLWVAATAVDAVHRLRLSSSQVEERRWPRRMEATQRELGVDTTSIDMERDQRLAFLGKNHTKHRSHLHLNAVARVGGRLLALFNRFGALCDLGTGATVVRDDRMVGAHNIVPISETLCLVNDTKRAAVLTVDIERRGVVNVVELRDFPFVRDLEAAALEEARRLGLTKGGAPAAVARALFVRGLTVYGRSAFIGLSPATILQVDLATGALVDSMSLSSDPRVCVHGLAIAPA